MSKIDEYLATVMGDKRIGLEKLRSARLGYPPVTCRTSARAFAARAPASISQWPALSDARAAKILDEHLAGSAFVACGRWLDGLMRIPAWADPWPAKMSAR